MEKRDKLAALRPVLDLFDPNVNMPVEQTRTIERDYGSSVPLPPGCVISPVDLGGVPSLRIVPVDADEDAAIIFYHAGGYSSGSLIGHAAYAAALCAAAGIIGFLPDYRLAPEHLFPAAIEDSCAAYQALIEQGYDPGSIALAGDSAGGGIVFAVAQDALAQGHAGPGCIYAMSPWADLTLSGASYDSRAASDPLLSRAALSDLARIYLGAHDPADPRASPLFGSFDAFPPTLIDAGADEVLLSDATRLADRLAMVGGEVELHVWQGLIHIFPWFAKEIEDGVVANARAGAWMRRQLKGEA